MSKKNNRQHSAIPDIRAKNWRTLCELSRAWHRRWLQLPPFQSYDDDSFRQFIVACLDQATVSTITNVYYHINLPSRFNQISYDQHRHRYGKIKTLLEQKKMFRNCSRHCRSSTRTARWFIPAAVVGTPLCRPADKHSHHCVLWRACAVFVCVLVNESQNQLYCKSTVLSPRRGVASFVCEFTLIDGSCALHEATGSWSILIFAFTNKHIKY